MRTVSAVLVAFTVAAFSDAARADPSADPKRVPTQVVLNYGVALDAIQIRDDLLRPLRWTGGGLALRAGLTVDAGALLHEGGLSVGAAPVWNRFGDIGLVLSQGLHYGLLARVAPRRPVSVLAGFVYRYESLDAYYADWDDSFVYWFTTHTLAPAVGLEAPLGSSARFWARMEIPVVGVMSRAPEAHVYKVDPVPYFGRYPVMTNRDPSLVGPADLFAPTWSARLDQRFGPHLGLRLGLDLWYRRALEPRGFFALGERVVVELRHAF